ncbi:MAG: hypothetical protein QXQ02_02550 [Halobacteria archaeon]
MISWDDFQKTIREVCLLTGQNPPKEQMQVIFKKIRDSELEDFKKACDDDQFLEEWSFKVSYPALKRAITKYQILRQEAEYAEARKKEQEELRQLIQTESIPAKVRQFLKTFGR